MNMDYVCFYGVLEYDNRKTGGNTMGCCDDPTEAVKINRNDLIRAQQQYGDLLRDLLTGDPEKVMLKQVKAANAYLRELAALNAHYDSVRKQAIALLDKNSLATLQRIVDKEGDNEFAELALQQIKALSS